MSQHSGSCSLSSLPNLGRDARVEPLGELVAVAVVAGALDADALEQRVEQSLVRAVLAALHERRHLHGFLLALEARDHGQHDAADHERQVLRVERRPVLLHVLPAKEHAAHVGRDARKYVLDVLRAHALERPLDHLALDLERLDQTDRGQTVEILFDEVALFVARAQVLHVARIAARRLNAEYHPAHPMQELEKPLKSNDLRDAVSDWCADFVEVKEDQELLFELILAANYLDIKSLLDLACVKVVTMIKGKRSARRSTSRLSSPPRRSR